MARAIDMAVEKAMPLSRDVGLSMDIEIAIGIAEGKAMTLVRAVDLGMAIEIAIAMGMAMFFCLGGMGLGFGRSSHVAKKMTSLT